MQTVQLRYRGLKIARIFLIANDAFQQKLNPYNLFTKKKTLVGRNKTWNKTQSAAFLTLTVHLETRISLITSIKTNNLIFLAVSVVGEVLTTC